MVHRAFQILAVCAGSCVVLGSFAGQDESKETAENVPQAKGKIALLLAKNQIVQSMAEKEAAAAKLSTKGRTLVERKYELIISELRQKHGLETWSPDEADELIAIRNAAAEFLDALVDARDNLRRKAQAKKKGPAGVTPGPSPNGPGFNPYGSSELSLGDLNKWRGDVIRQGDMICQNLQSSGEERDIRQAWRSIQDEVVNVFDRIYPVLLADKHVSNFHQEGLLQTWDRLASKEDLTMRVPGCTKVQMVSYKITDAFGNERRGTVAIGLFGTTSWDVLKENNGKGGFYELVKVDP